MTLVLAALVAGSLCPPVLPFVAGQNVQVIKGGKKGGSVKSTEVSVQVAPDAQATANANKTNELNQKSSALDAKAKQLDAKEAELKEREANAAEDKKRDEQQRALQKKIEQLGQQNRAAWQDAANALAGE